MDFLNPQSRNGLGGGLGNSGNGSGNGNANSGIHRSAGFQSKNSGMIGDGTKPKTPQPPNFFADDSFSWGKRFNGDDNNKPNPGQSQSDSDGQGNGHSQPDGAQSQPEKGHSRPDQGPSYSSQFNLNGEDQADINDEKKFFELLSKLPEPRKAVYAILEHLKRARHSALDCEANPNDYAVAISELLKMGVMHQIRWLVHHGLIAKRSNYGKNNQLVNEPLNTVEEDHFVISHLGLGLLVQLPADGSISLPRDENRPATNAPHYDLSNRILRFDGKVVKQFRWAAPNQERILEAFQEAGWPRRIAEPLPDDGLVAPKTRLHDTIKCLNRGRREPIIRFRGDGTGLGVIWEVEKSGDDDKLENEMPCGGQPGGPNETHSKGDA